MTVVVRPMPEEPADDAPFIEKLAWLLLTHGFCEQLDRVVRLYEPSDQCLLARPALTFSRKSWHEVVVGPKGGEKIVYVAAVWAARAERPKIRAIRMRPDKDFPTYLENGETFKNTYRRPVHKGSGDIQPWLDFMAHLLPDEIERNWFLDWLACKWVKPEIPGIAVVMVASDIDGQIFGTGRGMLRDIVQRLLGKAYARPVDFDVLTGKSSQSVFTDFLAGSVLIMVDEAKDTADAGRWSERRAVYERLKAVIDPRAIERSFTIKHGQMFYGLCFAGFLIATNNLDAIQIPHGDRRFGCLANGGRMTAEMAKKLQAWMDDPGNIAALARYLEARDIRAFNPYEAPVTLTKSVMQELARSERDEAFTTVRWRFGKSAFFTGGQFRTEMMKEVSYDTASREDFSAWVTQRLRAAATSDNEQFRMPERADGKRPLILRWRDYDGPKVEKVEDARGKVLITEQILKAKTDELAEQLRAMQLIHGGANEANKADEAAE